MFERLLKLSIYQRGLILVAVAAMAGFGMYNYLKLPIDAVPFAEGFTRDEQGDEGNPNAEDTRASTIKLLDLVEREHIGLVIFGHDAEQWETLKKAPEFYE